VAQVVYEAPARTDATANQDILIAARPVGTDASGQVFRSVRISLRSAEPRLFPEIPGINVSCDFIVEPAVMPYRVNQVVSFQSRGSSPGGPIVRYEWWFGDGTRGDKPQEAKVYRFAGDYQVFHVVTDRIGLQAACSTVIQVIP
jgi:hypothetical protein